MPRMPSVTEKHGCCLSYQDAGVGKNLNGIIGLNWHKKIFALGSVLTFSAVASAAFASPLSSLRQRRDVSELATNSAEYLPPAADAADAAILPEPESAPLGDEGYEYRAVRRLKLRHRNRRDVSHLPRQYLPPNNMYLPPAAADDTEEVISAAEPKVAREYLPPTVEQTEAPETEAPATEAPAADLEEPDVRVVDVPQPSGELLDDGYHYNKPAEVPTLREATMEYLPPVAPPVEDEESVVVEGPADGASAALAQDGYHYRAVRRYRF
ncbi:uncharacterized protein LOC115628425 [Scaptodrosophila lebanonensis]|uniref:Uncharacterized protein LOC115628425 n=1 Tax=Drosophila lebanonensis TaxID=7225 RepID=A0A6J2TZV8_DROLE|nr:uncharacterized protein LOC115628425 [Scaptodrosophila lebanonensis]